MDIQEKKAFEIAFDKKLGARGCQFDLDEDGNYEDRETLCGWHMWLEAKAQAVPKWISVKDNLPPANILVLGMSQTRSNIFNIYNVMALDEFEEAEVTHWMTLPDAPQEPTND